MGEDGAAYLRTTREGQGWESPRPPFDVVLHATARLASTSGRQAEGGQPYFSTAGGEPLACSLGAGQLPSGRRRGGTSGSSVGLHEPAMQPAQLLDSAAQAAAQCCACTPPPQAWRRRWGR